MEVVRRKPGTHSITHYEIESQRREDAGSFEMHPWVVLESRKTCQAARSRIKTLKSRDPQSYRRYRVMKVVKTVSRTQMPEEP